MPASFLFSAGTLLSFLLALARVGGLVTFLPMPGIRSAPELTRVVLALSVTLALAGSWPPPPAAEPALPLLGLWLLSEATLGLLLGLFCSLVVESFQLGAQVLGLQAGFSYASTVDPSSQADATILQVFSQLLAAMLFFALNFHHQVFRLLARSFEVIPPGTFAVNQKSAEAAVTIVGLIFVTGLKIALPVVALLLLVDIALALLSRIQAQLQLMTLVFPAKMLAAIGFLALTMWVMPSVAQTAFRRSMEAMAAVVGR